MTRSRRGRAGAPSEQWKVQKALFLLRQRRQALRQNIETKSFREIAKEVGVWSDATIRRWNKLAMDSRSRAGRIEKRGWNRKLTKEQEKIVAGWVVQMDLLKQSTTTQRITNFVRWAFNINVSASWITRFSKRHHLSLREPAQSLPNKTLKKKFSEAVSFLKKVRGMKKKTKPNCCR